MNPNYIFVPALGLAGVFFLLGFQLRKKLVRPLGVALAIIAGATLALPGALMVVYYFHLFDNAVWFYEFRALPYSASLVSKTVF